MAETSYQVNRSGLLTALIMAGTWWIRTGKWWTLPGKGLVLAKALWKSFTAKGQDRAPEWLYHKRLEQCAKCALFNHDRQTCGTAGGMYENPETKQREPLGCWCHMPSKAVLTESVCWLWWATGTDGWPEELNGPWTRKNQ